jgi:tetratricopeptide (TPR) repeat protein
MGVIWKGRDPHLGRDLAIKVLKGELAGKPTAEQRFVEEAQVGGQLQHPGIVPVHDLGRLADGRPYFAMKLVKGRTLADLLADRAPVAIAPSSPGDRGKFLRHFLQVCQTIAYAHAKGVIHRDIKPSNVMVGPFGEVLVMDWGLAKVLTRGGVADEERATLACRTASREREGQEEPAFIQTARSGTGSDTLAGSVMGTLSYMSPEQASGEIDKLDERADVFGLGAVLCEILTGQPPYVADSMESVREMAIRGQLDDAFARLGACCADLELVNLCKRCLSTRREARPRRADEVAGAIAAYLAGVEERAQQAEIDRAATEAELKEQTKRWRIQAALGAALAILVALGGAFGWWIDRQAADRRIETANRQRNEQERAGRNAEAVAALLGKCEDALVAGDSAKAAVVMEAAEKRAAEGGAESLTGRLARCRTDLDLLRELDQIDNLRWAVTEDRFRCPERVAQEWPGAFARFGILPGATSPVEAARLVNEAMIRDRVLGALDQWLAWSPSAELLTILRAADPDSFRNAVRTAIGARRCILVVALSSRPEALVQPGRFAAVFGSIGYLPRERREQLLVSALNRKPGDFGLLMTLAELYPTDTAKTAAEREKWLRAAVAVRPDNVAARGNLGVALHDKKDLDGAIAAYREVLRIDPRSALAHNNLGNALHEKGDLDSAIAQYRAAIRLEPNFANAHSNLGNALRDGKDLDGAIAEYRAAIRLDPKHVRAHNNLGNALRDAKDLDGAVAEYREAIRLSPELAPAHNNLGLALRDKGDVECAIASYREALRLDPRSDSTHVNLGHALSGKGDVEGAIGSYREALRLNPAFATAHNNLAWILATGPTGVRDGKLAVEHATKACELTAWKNPLWIDTLAAAYAETGDFDSAVEYQKKALSIPKLAMTHAEDGRKRLELYVRKKPFRDPVLAPRELAPPPRGVMRSAS